MVIGTLIHVNAIKMLKVTYKTIDWYIEMMMANLKLNLEFLPLVDF